MFKATHQSPFISVLRPTLEGKDFVLHYFALWLWLRLFLFYFLSLNPISKFNIVFEVMNQFQLSGAPSSLVG
jgi:hypothetical protein